MAVSVKVEFLASLIKKSENGAKLFLEILKLSDDEGCCVSSYGNLARLSGLPKGTIRRAIGKLRQWKLINFKPSKMETCIEIVNFGEYLDGEHARSGVVLSVFEFWNAQKHLTIHKLIKDHASAIEMAIKRRDVETVKTAIHRYNAWFQLFEEGKPVRRPYRWQLQHFLTRDKGGKVDQFGGSVEEWRHHIGEFEDSDRRGRFAKQAQPPFDADDYRKKKERRSRG